MGMQRRVNPRVWLAAALIALLANHAFAWGATRYFVCSGDAVARLQCCCPAMEAGSLDGGLTQLNTPCCCEISRAAAPANPPVPSTVRETGVPSKIFLAALGAAIPQSVAPPERLATTLEWTHPPAPFSIPILLQKQSFLI